MRPDNGKMRELVLYIAKRSESDPKFGKVKLNKLLFFSDFGAFRELGHPITGQQYKRLPQGPVPTLIEELLPDWQAQGVAAVVHAEYHGIEQHRVIARREPDTSLLSPAELEIVDRIIDRYWELNGTQISDVSHEFIGWKVAALGEEIPYQVAGLDLSPPTQEEEEWVAQVAARRRRNTPGFSPQNM